jgi:hypothetical protein
MHVDKWTAVFGINLCTLNPVCGSFACSFPEVSPLSTCLRCSRIAHKVLAFPSGTVLKNLSACKCYEIFLYVDAAEDNDEDDDDYDDNSCKYI